MQKFAPHLRHPRGRIDPALTGPRLLGFRVRLPLANVRLCSAASDGFGADTRRLGIAVTRLRLLHRSGDVTLPLDRLPAAPGFHAVEQGAWCWSDGDAVLPDALFAAPTGEALLLVEGFAPGGAALGAAGGPVIYLAGDSYPRDRPIEDRLFGLLEPLFAGRVHRQAAQFATDETPGPLPVAERLGRLERLLGTLADAERAVLIGRSSGARVATLCAHRRKVGAVVCLGYPFRFPGAPVEPERFAHLATLGTPTLILQGNTDPYGTAATVPGRYALSATVRVQEVAGNHEWHLDEAGWAAVERGVMLFLAGVRG